MQEPYRLGRCPLHTHCELNITEWLREENESGGVSYGVACFWSPDPRTPVCHLVGRRCGGLREIDRVNGIPRDMLIRGPLQVTIRVGNEPVIAFGQILARSGKGVDRRISGPGICHRAVRRRLLDLDRNRQEGQSQVEIAALTRGEFDLRLTLL